jgi:hypothetical protein
MCQGDHVSDSPQSTIVEYVIKYSSRGILLDTNILLVLVVGRMDPDRIAKFKNTHTFTKKDYLFLEEFLKHFALIAVTPHVLTEVSNLAAQLGQPAKGACFASFVGDIKTFHEGTETAKVICVSPLFKRLGITDAGIALIAAERFLVLTDDLNLYVELLKSNVDAINFNHIRVLG